MTWCDDDLVKFSNCENVLLSLNCCQSHFWSCQLNLILLHVGSDTLFSEQGEINQSLDVEGILDCAKSQCSLNISFALPIDGQRVFQQAASSINRSRRDDEKQGLKLLKSKMWFPDESCELHNTFWLNICTLYQNSDIAYSEWAHIG
jgi:hypothetical protein